jgi:hypothetical protein
MSFLRTGVHSWTGYGMAYISKGLIQSNKLPNSKPAAPKIPQTLSCFSFLVGIFYPSILCLQI